MVITRFHKFLDFMLHCSYKKSLLSKQWTTANESRPKKYHPVRDTGNSGIRNSGPHLVLNSLRHKQSRPRFSQEIKMFFIKPFVFSIRYWAINFLCHTSFGFFSCHEHTLPTNWILNNPFQTPKIFLLEMVSKPQIRLKSKAQTDEKAQHTRQYVSILKRPATSSPRQAQGLSLSKAAEPFATQLLGLRWGFETTSMSFGNMEMIL